MKINLYDFNTQLASNREIRRSLIEHKNNIILS